ncbi:hypothetical protein JST97_23495 [bacterium]|nr:hypothetical protein [bacterium]
MKLRAALFLVLWMLMMPLGAEGRLSDLLSEVVEAGQWSKSQASALLALLVADGKLQPQDTDLLEKLSTSPEPVKLSAEGREYVLPCPQGEARNLLGLLAKPPNLNVLFEGSPEQFGQIVDLSCITPALHDRVGQFLITRLLQVLQESSLSNAYAPTSGMLALMVRKCDQLDEERRKAGRLLIWQCCAGMREHGLKDKDGQVIQAFLYDWIPLR